LIINNLSTFDLTYLSNFDSSKPILLFSEILVQVLQKTGRGTGPNLQRRNTEAETETEAKIEKEAETEIEEGNGNTNIEDQALVQGKKLLTS
jgi:hypothetical protein